MSSIRNSEKNDSGNLLPHRRPRLAKYIALAIMLHVAFIIVYIYFTQRKTADLSEVKTPPVKVIPVSPKKNELHRHQVEPSSAPSSRAASRPMTPPRLMALPKNNNVISTLRRSDSLPMNKFIHSTKPNLITATAREGVLSDIKADREMEAWPKKQIAQRDMRFAPLSGSHFTPPQHRPLSQPQPRLINIGELAQPVIFSKVSTGREPDWRSEKIPPVAPSLSFPKDSKEGFQAGRPSKSFQTGKLLTIIQKVNLRHEPISTAVRIETTEKATSLSPEMVWQKEIELLPPLSNYVPLLTELPQLIEDQLADVVKHLIQNALQKYSEPMVRILAKNLTYRDLGLESEGTKFLSGLVKAEIEKQNGVELLSPADVSRNPHIVIEGEMWDDSDEIKVRLWSLDRGTGRTISNADLSVHRKMVSDKVEIQPPSSENLSMIQRMVELMKQNFPRGGDFQLGVWPDKGLDAVYQEGESLIVSILPEKDAYLHVDYFQIDGKVVHLLPNKHESNFIKGGEPYIIGDPKSGGYIFKVSDPFGEELLVAVASQNPIGAIAHHLIEPAGPYIKRLADSLGKQRKKTLMAGSHYIILTKKLDLQNPKNQPASTLK